MRTSQINLLGTRRLTSMIKSQLTLSSKGENKIEYQNAVIRDKEFLGLKGHKVYVIIARNIKHKIFCNINLQIYFTNFKVYWNLPM
jgi:hypothetical protein